MSSQPPNLKKAYKESKQNKPRLGGVMKSKASKKLNFDKEAKISKDNDGEIKKKKNKNIYVKRMTFYRCLGCKREWDGYAQCPCGEGQAVEVEEDVVIDESMTSDDDDF